MSLIVHMGPTKAASTWLQEVAFPQLRDVYLLGRKSKGAWTEDDLALVEAVNGVTRTDLEYRPGKLGALVRRALDEHDRVLVTDEGMLSTLRHRNPDHLARTMSRLADELGDFHAVYVAREPASLIRSTYLHYIRRGGRASLSRYCSGIDLGDAQFFPAMFDVSHIDRAVTAIAASTTPLIFERLSSSTTEFLEPLAERFPELRDVDLLGASRNVSTSMVSVAVLRRSNFLIRSRMYRSTQAQHLLSGMARSADRRLNVRRWRIERRLDHRARRLLGDLSEALYAGSHAEFQARTGIPLGTYGYALPQP